MEVDDEALGSAFGLGSVLASVGVDQAALSAFFARNGGEETRELATAIEAEGDREDYEDDVSEASLPDENPEDKRARIREQAALKAEEERWYQRALKSMDGVEGKSKWTADDAEQRKRRRKEEKESKRIASIWPDFAQGTTLKMSEVFYETPAVRRAREAALTKKKRRRMAGEHKHEEYVVQVAPPTSLPDSTTFLLPNLPPIPVPDPRGANYLRPLGALFDVEWIKSARDRRRKEMTAVPTGISLNWTAEDGPLAPAEARMLDLGEWEKDIVMCSFDAPPTKLQRDALAPRNEHLESGDWLKDVIWDARRVSPDLIEEYEDEEEPKEGAITSSATEKETTATTNAPIGGALTKFDPFNLSNDHFYEHTRAARFRIRQTFGAIEVFHSYPAKVLQMPFYKTSLTKIEARAWHRPALQFPTGVSFSFSKLKSNPSSTSTRKNKVIADPSERFKTTKDLSLTEKGPFVLLEFSEEYPPIMSSYGMGTTIVNYYRKKDDKDETVPKLDLGQPSILNVGDAEPFLLGYVDTGKVTQVIHNNLLRAPIFRHTPETSDFLVIRQTINGHSSYHLREIKNIFTVGQTVPNESEVPGPHARKNTNTAKMRLMVVAWLLIKKNKDEAKQRVKLSRLLRYFPDQTELQMRQRLKIKGNEFLEYDKEAGFHSGYWKLNPKYENFPNDRREVVELVSPEAAALFEAMQVAAQHLRDAGYSKTAEGNAEDEQDGAGESNLDIEQQLAVWSTTLNYKRAEAQKAWLLVHGEGDPTGRGEGFSFLKTNMKNYFLRKGETEEGRRIEAESRAGGGPVKISNSEQNRIYEEEKRKVWDLQAKALSNPVAPELSPEDEHIVTGTPSGSAPPLRFQRQDSFARRPFSRAGSHVATPMHDSPMEDPRSPSALSVDGESAFTGNDRGASKVLRIKRIVKGKPVVEVVRDPAVIQSYLRRVEERKLAQYTDELDHLAPSGNMEEDELKIQAIRQEVLRLKKNQQRRQQRKKYMGKGELPDVGDDIEGKRRCGACGAYGHTKANRNCPKFNAQAIGPSPSATPAAGPTPYGYGGGMDTTPSASTPDMGAPSPAPMKIKLALGNRQ